MASISFLPCCHTEGGTALSPHSCVPMLKFYSVPCSENQPDALLNANGEDNSITSTRQDPVTFDIQQTLLMNDEQIRQSSKNSHFHDQICDESQSLRLESNVISCSSSQNCSHCFAASTAKKEKPVTCCGGDTTPQAPSCTWHRSFPFSLSENSKPFSDKMNQAFILSEHQPVRHDLSSPGLNSDMSSAPIPSYRSALDTEVLSPLPSGKRPIGVDRRGLEVTAAHFADQKASSHALFFTPTLVDSTSPTINSAPATALSDRLYNGHSPVLNHHITTSPLYPSENQTRNAMTVPLPPKRRGCYDQHTEQFPSLTHPPPSESFDAFKRPSLQQKSLPSVKPCTHFSTQNQQKFQCCVLCGEKVLNDTVVYTCCRPTCQRYFCVRCTDVSLSKTGTSIFSEYTNECIVCSYQSRKRSTEDPREWHCAFKDSSDGNFVRMLRDMLPVSSGLFIEISKTRQPCWRRKVENKARKHFSFRFYGGIFESRLEALQLGTPRTEKLCIGNKMDDKCTLCNEPSRATLALPSTESSVYFGAQRTLSSDQPLPPTQTVNSSCCTTRSDMTASSPVSKPAGLPETVRRRTYFEYKKGDATDEHEEDLVKRMRYSDSALPLCVPQLTLNYASAQNCALEPMTLQSLSSSSAAVKDTSAPWPATLPGDAQSCWEVERDYF